MQLGPQSVRLVARGDGQRTGNVGPDAKLVQQGWRGRHLDGCGELPLECLNLGGEGQPASSEAAQRRLGGRRRAAERLPWPEARGPLDHLTEAEASELLAQGGRRGIEQAPIDDYVRGPDR
jgi:hypothetical protein